jgi:hypothetical protein
MSNPLLDHLYYIEKDLIDLPKKNNNLNFDSALISIELLDFSKIIYSFIENSKFNKLLSDKQIIQIMDIFLSISAEFSVEVSSFDFNKHYSFAVQEASDYLYLLYNDPKNRNLQEIFFNDHYKNIERLLMFFYDSKFVLEKNDKIAIKDLSEKMALELSNESIKGHDSFTFKLFSLKNFYGSLKMNQKKLKNE